MSEVGEISGHVDVQCVLGCMFAFGEGVEKDPEKAFTYWKKAAMHDHGESAFNVAICYRDGKGLPPATTTTSVKSIIDWFSCNPVDFHADAEEWKAAENGQCEETALRWFTVAAEQNHVLALLACGAAYYHGHGCYIDTERAAEYYMRAVAKKPENIGEMESLFELLDLNHDGVLTKAEVVDGHKLLNTTVEGATRLFDRLDIDLDGELSLEEFFRKQGYRFDHIAMETTSHAVLKASVNLAVLYRHGDGVPKSLYKSLALYKEVVANEDEKHAVAKAAAVKCIAELTAEVLLPWVRSLLALYTNVSPPCAA